MNLKHIAETIAAAAILMAGPLYGDVISSKQIPLKNADFEKVNANGKPENWSTGNARNLIIRVETAKKADNAAKSDKAEQVNKAETVKKADNAAETDKAEQANKAEKANQFVTLRAEKPVVWANLYQPALSVREFPALAAGQKYEIVLKFRAKTANLKGYAVGALEFKAANGKRVSNRNGQGLGKVNVWKNQTLVWRIEKLPANAALLTVAFFLNGTGSLSVDDVTLSVRVIGKK